MTDLKLPAAKHGQIVEVCKHLLAMARAGRVVAIGFAVLNLDDDGDVSAGTNAVWADSSQVREALKKSVATLGKRIGEKSPLIIQ